jgi:4-hydroxybenzoyl-CoA thioesterase
MSFRCRIPVRFGDIDQAGIAYYPTLFDHCHTAFEEFFGKGLGVPYPKVLLKDRLGFPTVHLEADFLKPLKFGDLLSVEVTVARIGTRSVVFRYRASAKGRSAFRVLVTTACLDMRTFKARPVPARYRRLLARHLIPN